MFLLDDMKRKYRISILIASLVLLSVAITMTGVSYAVWTSSIGSLEGGTSSVAPSVTPTYNGVRNYVWAKYFNINVIEAEDGTKCAQVTTFYTGGDTPYGINLGDVVIPDVFWYRKNSDGTVSDERLFSIDGLSAEEYEEYQTYSIANTIFADITLQQLPERIYIPQGVRVIEDFAFAALPNLKEVYFFNENTCKVGEYAFVGCIALENVYGYGTGNIEVADTSFDEGIAIQYPPV